MLKVIGEPDRSVTALRDQLTHNAPFTAAAQTRLHRILAAPEFAQADRVPTFWDRWKQEFGQWLAHQIEQLFQAAAQHPTTSQIIFWGAAVAALAFIAFQLFRLWNGGTKTLRTTEPDTPTAAYRSAEWLTAATHAASAGDLNRAIQCAYWSGVVSLQEQNALPDDAVHTPRELLTSLRRSDAAAPLRSLTDALERFWYAHRPAAEDDWARCLASLKALECKQD